MKPQLREKLKEIAKEVMAEDAEYQQFFKTALEKSGKSIPDMSDDEKKAFFDKVDAAWDGKGEKREVNESVKKKITLEVKFDKSITEAIGGNFNVDDSVTITNTKKFNGVDISKPAKIIKKNKEKAFGRTVYTYNIETANGKHPFDTATDADLKLAKNEAITEMGEGDYFYKKIMKLYDKGGEFTKKKIAAAVSHNPNATRDKIVTDLRNMDHNDITKSADKLRIESNRGTGKFVKEAVSSSDIDRIKQIVQNHVDSGGKFIGLWDKLKRSFKTDFTTVMGTPMITIKLGSTIYVLMNKKYVEDPDFTIGDIAGGPL